jgi:hypothetical protein
MKKLFFILLLVATSGFAQKTKTRPDTVCFTRQQVEDISMTLDSLWQADDINNELIASYKIVIAEQDSLIADDSALIAKRDEEIALLNSQIADYKTKVDLLQPKWHDKKSLWFGFGFLSALGTGIIVNQLIK